MINDIKKLNIKDWAEEDRPREKMMLKGIATLSDAELLGILIASGNTKETAVQLAQRILHSVSHNLNTLGKLSIKELIKNFSGIGEAKAITIVAALELGRRRNMSEALIQNEISSSRQAYDVFHPLLADIKHEEMWVLLLNSANREIKKIQISKGGIASTTIDIRMIMKEAIDALASRIILCHNHPSGSFSPSIQDDTITQALKEAGQIMDIELIDHIIVCDNGYYSYRDAKRLT